MNIQAGTAPGRAAALVSALVLAGTGTVAAVAATGTPRPGGAVVHAVGQPGPGGHLRARQRPR